MFQHSHIIFKSNNLTELRIWQIARKKINKILMFQYIEEAYILCLKLQSNVATPTYLFDHLVPNILTII